MNEINILVVDDESVMRKLIKIYLSKEFTILEASSGKEALTIFQTKDLHLIILDIMMPDMTGWEVCRKIRDINANVPILMLTARTDVEDKVKGLTLGADDYLVKPFESIELVARVKALLRRVPLSQTETDKGTIEVAKLSLNLESRQVFANNIELLLTPKEFDLLNELVRHPKRIYTREILLDKIWGENEILDIRTVDTHIKNIREKVKKTGSQVNPIKTVWGVGYKINLEEDLT